MALVQADVITEARSITGNKTSRAVGEVYISDDDIIAGMRSMIRDLTNACTSNGGVKEVDFDITPDTQDYTLTDIANDIGEILFVVRSGGRYPNLIIEDGVVDPRTGFAMPGRLIIDPGLQRDTMDVILAQRRFRLDDDCTWEIINGKLRLYPYPTFAEKGRVRYVATGTDITDLPESAMTAAVMGATVVLFNLMLNRINSDRATGSQHGVVSEERIKLLIQQRDYYAGEWQRELALLNQ